MGYVRKNEVGSLVKLKQVSSETDSPNTSNPYRFRTTITTEKIPKHDNVKVM